MGFGLSVYMTAEAAQEEDRKVAARGTSWAGKDDQMGKQHFGQQKAVADLGAVEGDRADACQLLENGQAQGKDHGFGIPLTQQITPATSPLILRLQFALPVLNSSSSPVKVQAVVNLTDGVSTFGSVLSLSACLQLKGLKRPFACIRQVLRLVDSSGEPAKDTLTCCRKILFCLYEATLYFKEPDRICRCLHSHGRGWLVPACKDWPIPKFEMPNGDRWIQA